MCFLASWVTRVIPIREIRSVSSKWQGPGAGGPSYSAGVSVTLVVVSSVIVSVDCSAGGAALLLVELGAAGAGALEVLLPSMLRSVDLEGTP